VACPSTGLASVPTDNMKEFFFSTPGCFFEAGRSKKCLGLFGPKPSRSEAIFPYWRCLYGTRN
jgi:hypothetical protein